MFSTTFSLPFSNQHSSSLKPNTHPIIPKFGANKGSEVTAITRDAIDTFKSSNPHVKTGQVKMAKRDLNTTFGHPDDFKAAAKGDKDAQKAQKAQKDRTNAGIEVATATRSNRLGKRHKR